MIDKLSLTFGWFSADFALCGADALSRKMVLSFGFDIREKR
jgi:hypothetical protein